MTAYFAYSILTLGIASASGHRRITGGLGALIGLGAFLVTIVVSLSISDWIRSRYPLPGETRAADRDSVSD